MYMLSLTFYGWKCVSEPVQNYSSNSLVQSTVRNCIGNSDFAKHIAVIGYGISSEKTVDVILTREHNL